MLPFQPLLLVLPQHYRKDVQTGAYYLRLMPYSLMFFAEWNLLLLA
nr:AbgT family transporter [Serratia fonticola]